MSHAFSLIIDSVKVTGESLQAVALPDLIPRKCRAKVSRTAS
jgi:hypothetical protein